VKEIRRKTPIPERGSADADRLSPVAALVRRHDPDRFQTVLFAPAARREALFALYAFNYEIARVRETVTQPMLGQIRLQWWRENIAAAFTGDALRRHSVVEPLAAAIGEFGLTRDHFDRLIDARATDLADEPPASLAALEDYAEASSSRLIYLALEVLGVRDPVAGRAGHHIGIAYALTGLLRAMRFHARAGRRFIPDDVADRSGLAEQDYRALHTTPALRRASTEVAAAAERHVAAARTLRRQAPAEAVPALLPAVIARRALARLRRVDYDPFDHAPAAPDPLQSWRLAAASFFSRF